ncbi:MAG: hypothetical protein MJ211_08535 [Bacteroidales bacterium]|nr:hypothetical protein [Bacteroidales bacterium]
MLKRILFATFLFFSVTIFLTSCDDDEDSPLSNLNSTKSISGDYSFELNSDMLKIFDATVYYYDFKDFKSVKLTENTFSVKNEVDIKDATLGLTIGWKLVLTPKTNIPDQDSYEVGISVSKSIKTNENKSIAYNSNKGFLGVKKEKILDYIEKYSVKGFQEASTVYYDLENKTWNTKDASEFIENLISKQ